MMEKAKYTICPDCEGEGSIEYEISGGRWNSYAQGGMWEPWYGERPCERCDGLGMIEEEEDEESDGEREHSN